MMSCTIVQARPTTATSTHPADGVAAAVEEDPIEVEGLAAAVVAGDAAMGAAAHTDLEAEVKAEAEQGPTTDSRCNSDRSATSTPTTRTCRWTTSGSTGRRMPGWKGSGSA